MKFHFKKRRTVLIIVGSLAALLLIVLFYSDRGIIHLNKLKEERDNLEITNREILEENRKLLLKIDRIKKDPKYIEDEARKKLGLVRPDELIIQLKETDELIIQLKETKDSEIKPAPSSR